MSVLVLAENANGAISDATRATITAALQLGEVHVLVAGEGDDAAKVAQSAAETEGVSKVLLANDPAYAEPLAESIAPLVVGLMGDYSALLAPASTTGKNIAPRIAALLDVMQVSDIISVEGPKTFTRPIYAGSAIATVSSSDETLVVTVRGTAFAKAEAGGELAPIEQVEAAPSSPLSSFVSLTQSGGERPDLTSAKVVVSGGRALKDGDTFQQILSPLADKLGAAIGASRAAVDAGYISNEFQVGQTGKIVAPDLYIAVGISGAIQHLAGIKDAGIIVAINKDPEAPIFQIADYGLVADLFEAVPELTEKL